MFDARNVACEEWEDGLDFDKVRPVDGSVRTGFEELCVALTQAICESPLTDRVRIDGAGGDGGVELLGTTQDGRRIGIQAKHFTKRLQPSQWQQIVSSVATAMRNHPGITHYFVCAGLDRTPKEIDKWIAQKAKWLSEFPNLSVSWVGRSELTGLLTQARWRYLAVYWLDRADFSLDRVRDRSEVAIKQLHHRFTPQLHHKTAAENALGHMLALPFAKYKHRQMCVKLATGLHAFLDAMAEAKGSAIGEAHTEVRSAASQACLTILDTIADGDLSSHSGAFEVALANALPPLHAFSSVGSQVRYQARHDGKNKDVASTQTVLNSISNLCREIEAVLASVQSRTKAINSNCWLITGEAGTGKSHLLATVVRRHIGGKGAALMFLGEQFQDIRPLSLQICDQFGWSRDFSELLGCLQAYAELTHHPSLLVVDAINETPHRSLWLTQLVGLEREFEPYPNVHLVISCRDDWLKSCVPDAVAASASRVKHRGYDLDFQEIVTAYFQGYDVTSDRFPPLIPEYSNPLFLKTVCEAYRGRMLPAAPLSFVQVLEVWEGRVAEEILNAIDCPAATTKKAISTIVEEMARTNESLLPSAAVRKICTDLFPIYQEKSSLFRHLQTQGFMHEVGVGEAAKVRLQYERFYDVRVVQAELAKLPDADAFRAHWRTNSLPNIGQHRKDEISIPRMFAYALLVPEQYGIELPELQMPPRHEKFAFAGEAKVWEAWLDALAWRQIPASHDDIRRLFLKWTDFKFRQCHFEVLFTFACIEQHPLNADYLHSLLSTLDLVKRELIWTVPMSYKVTDSEEWDLDRFVRWCDGARRKCSEEQARLAATVLLWLTSVTNWRARDTATQATIRLLEGRLEATMALVDMFWDVNDPYVKERLLAVIAGVAPALSNRESLRRLASEVCGRFFLGGNVSLNIMEREYARFLAEFAHQRGALDHVVYQASRPPYMSQAPEVWSEEQVAQYESDSAYGSITSSIAPEEMGPGLYGDFGRYVMGSAVHSFVNPKRAKAGAKSGRLGFEEEDARIARRYLWRRIIEMGWTPERFGEFERNLYSSGRERPTEERISKKYQWIALYEYLGHLSDHRAYMNYGDDSPRLDVRASDLMMRDFNPSTADFTLETADDNALTSTVLTGSPVPPMKSMSERTKWISGNFGSFVPYLHFIIEGKPRLLLSAHFRQSEPLPIGRTRSNSDHASQWIDVRSFLVDEDMVDALSTKLSKMNFWGKGVELPRAYDCWLGEYPWHSMLRYVRESCAKAEPWFDFPEGLARGTACSLDSEDNRFVLPSPDFLKDIGASIGPLSSPKWRFESTYAIQDQRGENIFWGSTARNTLLAVDYFRFADWMRNKRLVLMWCCLSERTVSSAHQRDSHIAESTQSAVVILRPYTAPVELTGERNDW